MCERLVAGDEAALGELYDELSPLVYGLAVRVTRDWAAAEDITQDVFLRVWRDPRAFDPARGTWGAWLGTMTHRRAVDWVRRSAARQRRAADAAPPVAAPDPEETAVAGSVAKSVQAAIDDLPATQREAIRLAYFDGLTYRQVAETLGIPEGTAKSRLWLGLRRLGARLEAEGIEP
ncbi:MAG TPA: sigma-70 family RNA polymerase sigma factor [Actinomycetota bacterium]|nr:sigma-70 family RNA polymerase sigma factor [Actinomycetota bacterium]